MEIGMMVTIQVFVNAEERSHEHAAAKMISQVSSAFNWNKPNSASMDFGEGTAHYEVKRFPKGGDES